MAIIYANNNELKALDNRVSALPDPVPPTPAADYYRHKVTIGGESEDMNGHLYYTSTSSAALASADTAENWFNNVYSSGFATPGCFSGTIASWGGADVVFTILKLSLVTSETGEAGVRIDIANVEQGVVQSGFASVVTDEIIDL